MIDRGFVHPTALVETDDVGEGTRIWAFAHVLKGARIGRGCNIGDHCFVEGRAVLGDRVTLKNGISVWDAVTIEDDVFVGPNVVFTNERVPRASRVHRYRSGELSVRLEPIRVGTGATVGANATIVAGVTVGAHAFIGAGSVVTRDVPPYAIVYGVPARRRGYMCACGERITFRAPCACGQSYRKNARGTVESSDRVERRRTGATTSRKK